jgi:hypothetical protein
MVWGKCKRFSARPEAGSKIEVDAGLQKTAGK